MSSPSHLPNSFSLPYDSIDRLVLDELEEHCSCLPDQLIEWPDAIKVRIKKGAITLYDQKTKLTIIGEGEQGYWATYAYLRTLQKATSSAVAATAPATSA